jgi:carboxymethylenebutenolidase
MLRNQRIAPFVSLALLACLTASVTAESKIPVRSFTFGEKSIAVEHFAPPKEGKHPAVLLIHGTAGLEGEQGQKGDAELYRFCARILAGQGYHALVVHYFDSTGTKRIDPREARKDEKLLRTWMETVCAAVRFAAKLPGVDAKRIGLIGFSLGAFLSLAAAIESETPVAAVVDLFGGLPKRYRAKADKLPPTLILHGGADKVVPVKEAQLLKKLLRKPKRADEIMIYEKADHLFGGNFFCADACDARKRTLEFLAKHLKAKPEVAARSR